MQKVWDEATGHSCLIVGWAGVALAFNPTIIPIILSSIASSLAIVNYLINIKKNRK